MPPPSSRSVAPWCSMPQEEEDVLERSGPSYSQHHAAAGHSMASSSWCSIESGDDQMSHHGHSGEGRDGSGDGDGWDESDGEGDLLPSDCEDGWDLPRESFATKGRRLWIGGIMVKIETR
eukprot:scaffold22029_cov117-Isochrysis_galbana.AAC.1